MRSAYSTSKLTLNISGFGDKADILIGWPMSANDPTQTTQSHKPTISPFALPGPSFPCHKKWVVVAFGLNGISATQGSSNLPLYLPAERVSVRFSLMYVPPPLTPWNLPVPPANLHVDSLRCEPSSQLS